MTNIYRVWKPTIKIWTSVAILLHNNKIYTAIKSKSQWIDGLYLLCVKKKKFERKISCITFDLVSLNLLFMSKNIILLYGRGHQIKYFQLYSVWLINFRMYYKKRLYFKTIKFILYLMLHDFFIYLSNFYIKL